MLFYWPSRPTECQCISKLAILFGGRCAALPTVCAPQSPICYGTTEALRVILSYLPNRTKAFSSVTAPSRSRTWGKAQPSSHLNPMAYAPAVLSATLPLPTKKGSGGRSCMCLLVELLPLPIGQKEDLLEALESDPLG